ncbi:PREDICTED: cytochrome P450-like [Ipomoea nil]|uniref:cytochrome P450-like n=1 Tax=Ipomoea nil TaxID=35883 RepID=UPI0009018D4B|nr:PREDICTED: cytochrome P450-like [Ipomoea nil]
MVLLATIIMAGRGTKHPKRRQEMQYLQAAISEAMRLYPPVPVDTKACLKDDVMPDGMFIGKGWFATYHTYAMGRMEKIWGKDCCEYKPERWLDENGEYRQESLFRFPVFHGGPRMCLGKKCREIHCGFDSGEV